MSENSRWKSIQSYEQLANYLHKHTDIFLYDTQDRERRYVLRDGDGCFCRDVDGRSVRAVWRALEQIGPKGGYQFRNATPEHKDKD